MPSTLSLQLRLRLVAPLWISALLGCGGADLVLPSHGEPVQVTAVQGDRQEGPAGERLDDFLVVRVLDTAGSGVPRRAITWVVSIGGGSVLPETDTTDADGFARTQWTLGPEPGANAVRAMVSDAAFVMFTAVGTGDGGAGPAPSATRSTISADPSSIPAVTGRSTITVTVRDGQGDPVAGASVSLEASGAANSLTQPESATGADGTTSGTLAGAAPGTITISATVNRSVPLAQTTQVTVTQAAGPQVDHFVFRLQPHDVRKGERFRVEAALAAKDGSLVPLSGILMYLGLFPEGSDTPDNDRLSGDRFRETENGVAVFDDLSVTKKGRYRLRVLSDQLPELGPHGPEPYLFSVLFEVK